MAKQQKSGSGFFFGLMLGLAVGATLAILFAPQPGEETRSQLNEQIIELRRRGQEGYGATDSQLRDRYGAAFAQYRDAYERARDEVLTRYNKAKNNA